MKTRKCPYKSGHNCPRDYEYCKYCTTFEDYQDNMGGCMRRTVTLAVLIIVTTLMIIL